MRQRWRLLAFIGILMCMGIVRQSVTEHFRVPQDGEIDLRIPAIRAWGLRQLEFEQIMRYLHFADNTAIDVGEDRAAKVRPLLKEFKDCCIKFWVPGKNQAIDEMMIRFKGRLGWRQYMKDKPIKFGMKIWGMCESQVGYLSNFDLYTGKKGKTVQKGLAMRVVLKLVTELLAVHAIWWGGHLYMDNFYTSLPLFIALWVLGIPACGTLRAKRTGTPDLGVEKSDARDTYEWQALQNHDCHAVCGAWRDNSVTRFLSTIHDAARKVHKRLRKKRDGGGQVEVNKPLAVLAYTAQMDGCDVGDQKRSYYATSE